MDASSSYPNRFKLFCSKTGNTEKAVFGFSESGLKHPPVNCAVSEDTVISSPHRPVVWPHDTLLFLLHEAQPYTFKMCLSKSAPCPVLEVSPLGFTKRGRYFFLAGGRGPSRTGGRAEPRYLDSLRGGKIGPNGSYSIGAAELCFAFSWRLVSGRVADSEFLELS